MKHLGYDFNTWSLLPKRKMNSFYGATSQNVAASSHLVTYFARSSRHVASEMVYRWWCTRAIKAQTIPQLQTRMWWCSTVGGRNPKQPPFGWCKNPVNNGISTTNLKLVSLPDFWTINSMSFSFWKEVLRFFRLVGFGQMAKRRNLEVVSGKSHSECQWCQIPLFENGQSMWIGELNDVGKQNPVGYNTGYNFAMWLLSSFRFFSFCSFQRESDSTSLHQS